MFPWFAGRKVAASGVSVLCLLRELGVWLVVAVKWHVNGEGKPGKCSAEKGPCPFGADAPHFGTKREAEAAAEELIARESSGFGGDAGSEDAGVRDAFASDSGFVVDAAGRFYRRDGEVATCVSGADVSRWNGSGDVFVDIIDGGGAHALNADRGQAHVLYDVNDGTVGGSFSAVSVYGCQLDEVTGNARLNNVGISYRSETASAPVSTINVVSDNGRVLRLAPGCRVGSVTDGGWVRDVYGGNIGEVSGRGRVNVVTDGGLVGAVVENGVVENVSGGGRVETVSGRGVVEYVTGDGTVDVVDGLGTVRCVTRGGRVEYMLGASSLDVNEGVVGFVGSPTAPAEGGYGASLADNRAGGRVECVRAGGVVHENMSEVDNVLPGGVVERVCDRGEVGSLLGRVGYVSGPDARVSAMGGSEGSWAEISLVRCSASVNEGDGARYRPVVGFVGPYSRVAFETSSAEEALACIGRVDRGALEAGLVDIRYRGRMGESLVPLLREREGLPPVE